MTQSYKLLALIQKSIDGGWENGQELLPFEVLESIWPQDTPLPSEFPEGFGRIKHLVLEMEDGDNVNVEAVLFDNDFARSLFKDFGTPDPNTLQTLFGSDDYLIYTGEAWQYHLQQAVILPTTSEQIDYMYEVVFGAEE